MHERMPEKRRRIRKNQQAVVCVLGVLHEETR